ncbi:uncharacterized protein HD556DRAFT_1306732 [Suillus plorans]|uniref:Uncharacterized protein n=1 Tax=Suillus plorans TaxID=116603 RepID=A0A9P7DKG1_9AGAM|nr:uncharacterized protein HD556DRAFT_1306732 [Suillus plorans]KAG1797033.1 hypothetical protein HD556DRAFT_1306732 [Suillus plorans]
MALCVQAAVQLALSRVACQWQHYCCNNEQDTEAPAGLVSRNTAAGPSTESGGKISKVKTKKKASPTTRKVKATDDYFPYYLSGNDVSEAETTKIKPAPNRRKPNIKPMIMAHIYAAPESSNRKMRMPKEKPPDIPKVKTKAEAP